MSDSTKLSKSINTRRKFLRNLFGVTAAIALPGSFLSACGDPTATTVPLPTSTPIPTTTPLPATLATTAGAIPASTPAPTATPVPRQIKFVVFGDLRTGGLKPPPIFNKLVNLAKEYKPEAVLIMGDIIYSEDDNNFVRQQWKEVFNSLKPLGDIPILPTLGNHDTNYRKGALPLYVEAFASGVPQNGPAGLQTLVYSQDIGPVHFVSLASELPDQIARLSQTQISWLETDLKKNRQPYTIVFAHDPAFPAGPYKNNCLDINPKERDAFWKLLSDNKVTAYLAGHEHLYNRSTHNGVAQLIIGTSGSSPYGGFGGDFYHFASFETGPEGLLVRIIDESGKERDRISFKPNLIG